MLIDMPRKTNLPMKPVWVYIADKSSLAKELALKGIHYQGNVTVDADDLAQRFSDRLRVRSRLNTDTGVVTRHAYFNPPLGDDDIRVLMHLSKTYQRRLRDHRTPLRAPVNT
jgi:hypothetical protein